MEHFDVLIVGAGLSGIGAAYRLQTQDPHKTYAIVEARHAIGGTWDLFRYPGIRSDSDMFTLGYPFRPWADAQPIADGASIRAYIDETAAEYGINRKIRFGQTVTAVSWDSHTARWTVDVEGQSTYTCGFLFMCSGYYSYESGYEPRFAGQELFHGQVVHPQNWPEDLDYTGKRVVIIGSGATAVTLLPALSAKAGHVTMLQRSPSYVATLAAVDPVAAWINRLLPKRIAHRANRMKSIVFTLAFYQYCQRFPRSARRFLRRMTAAQLPPGYPVDIDFNPRYDPWDQRMCVVPDGDLFKSIATGHASVVTGRVAAFNGSGIVLESGEQIDADIAVTATGLRVVPLGEVSVTVDGIGKQPADMFVYRGCMLSGMPNFAMCVGYTNASWTLRADLTSIYVCRVLRHMDHHRYVMAIPHRAGEGGSQPLLELTSGYVQRSAAVMPKQGEDPPWRMRQNYLVDYFTSHWADVTADMTFR